MGEVGRITLLNKQGVAQLYKSEEILNQKLNSWKNWFCGIGYDNLYIKPNGDIYGGSCAVGGCLGNALDPNVTFPTHFLKCTKDWCTCGTDMAIRKYKDSEDQHLVQIEPIQYSKFDPKSTHAMTPENYKDVLPKQILWELGKRCNYSCSYCPPNTSNHTDGHLSWESLEKIMDGLFDKFVKNIPTKFLFTGGEPTLNPSFLKLVKWIKSQPSNLNGKITPHQIHVTTNGSRTPDYFLELFEFAEIGISAHLNDANLDKLSLLISTLLKYKINEPIKYSNWLGLRIMLTPGDLSKANYLIQLIEKAIPNWKNHIYFSVSPIIDFQNYSEPKVMNYSIEENEFMNSQL